MSNKRDLKAFVRFDGSGRIVAGSLILRKKKPKVGKWHEIQAYECCNYIPSPTTTTTTTQGGPTAWTAYTSFNAFSSCQQTGGLLTTLYSSTSTLTSGTYLFTDPELTEPYNYFSGTFVAINNQVWEVTSVNGPIENPQACSSITTTTTTTTIPSSVQWSMKLFVSEGDACVGTTFLSANGYTASGTLAPGTQVWANPELTVPFSTLGNGFVNFIGDSTIFTISQFSVTVLTGTITC